MFANLTGWHALIIIGALVLLFGATKLPLLAKSVGQSMRVFKTEIKPELTGSDSTTEQPGTSTP